jgi:tRNA(Ile)-lysidine synthase
LKKKVFSTSELTSILSNLPSTKHYWVAYSGGMDSTVLLHAISQSRKKLQVTEVTAVHVNHGINKDADLWADHCRIFCAEINIDFEVLNIDARHEKGESPEAKARELRYQAIKSLMSNDDILLTAHHQNDQAETFLLQLLRGSGAKGLSCMPLIRGYGKGSLVRPLLTFSREQLAVYAKQENLVWIEDISNENTDYDRNHIRRDILPIIEKRWPAAVKTIARSADHQAEITEILDEVVNEDFKKMSSSDMSILEIEKINLLPLDRRKYMLYFWLRKLNLPVPNSQVMQKLIEELINAAWDSEACVRWKGVEVRRYRNKIYAMNPLPNHDPDVVYTWKISQPLELSVGILKAKRNRGKGIKVECIKNENVEVRYRQGGEYIQPYGKSHKCELKKLFQENGILPWQRNRMPLIYLEDKLIAVSDLWVDAAFYATGNEEGWTIFLVN